MTSVMAFRMLPARSARVLQTAAAAARPARGYATKAPNPTTQFYKTFTRPVAKVMLMAVFTYQVLYWSWVKLEQDEVRAETDATIETLEASVSEYEQTKSTTDTPATKKS